MHDKSKSDATAQRKLELLGPLLAPGLDKGKYLALKQQVAETSGLSERTIRRYMKDYETQGYEGLKAKSRGRKKGQTIPPQVLSEAILLRREVPGRSVSQIIEILESEGLASPGTLKRSTLQDYFQAQGYSARQMRLYTSISGSQATRRFQRLNRNDLWQSDIKYGQYLPIGKKGILQQTYLVTFIDDATRSIIHSEFYATLDQSIVEEAFKSALIKWGAPRAVYYDNGKQYRNKWMTHCCHDLNIRLLYAKPYAAQSKGKVEKFNRLTDNFLAESRLKKPATLAELNSDYAAWLSECYQHKPHSALKNSATGTYQSPHTAYQSDKTPLRFIPPDQLNAAFVHREERRVDKAGCISLKGIKYDTGPKALGKKVTVTYDPKDTDEINITLGRDTWTAQKLKIGPYCDPKAPKIPKPEQARPQEPRPSRVLNAAAQKHAKRTAAYKQAISYSSISSMEEA